MNVLQVGSSGFTCSACNPPTVIPVDKQCLLRDLRHCHGLRTSNKENCPIACGQNGCTTTFDTFKSFNRHLDAEVCNKPSVVPPALSSPFSEHSSRDREPSDTERDTDAPHSYTHDEEHLILELATHLLRLVGQFNVSNRAIDYIGREQFRHKFE